MYYMNLLLHSISLKPYRCNLQFAMVGTRDEFFIHNMLSNFSPLKRINLDSVINLYTECKIYIRYDISIKFYFNDAR